MISGAILPGGDYVVVAGEHGHAIAQGDFLRKLSAAGAEAVACQVEEHVMCSESCLWRDGQQVWRIVHDAEAGITHLEAEGDCPAVFPEVRDQLAAEQEADSGEKSSVDYYFNIPVDVAHVVGGYHHEEMGLEDTVFELLEPVQRSSQGPPPSAPPPPPAERKSFLRRLFGG